MQRERDTDETEEDCGGETQMRQKKTKRERDRDETEKIVG